MAARWLPFLLNLLPQRLQLRDPTEQLQNWQLGANGAILIVSFRGSEQGFLRTLRESEPLGELWHRNVSDIQLVSYRPDETLGAPQIAHELVRRIQRSRRDSVPIESIAFVGIEALRANLPNVAAAQSFWPTILATAASEGISTTFVVIDPDGSSQFVAEYGREMDYVLKFGRRGTDRTIEIEKSPDPPAEYDYPKLRFDPQLGPMVSVSVASRATSVGAPPAFRRFRTGKGPRRSRNRPAGTRAG